MFELLQIMLMWQPSGDRASDSTYAVAHLEPQNSRGMPTKIHWRSIINVQIFPGDKTRGLSMKFKSINVKEKSKRKQGLGF
jgi:hypothetical protein